MINMSYNAEVSSVFNWDVQNFLVDFLAKISAWSSFAFDQFTKHAHQQYLSAHFELKFLETANRAHSRAVFKLSCAKM